MAWGGRHNLPRTVIQLFRYQLATEMKFHEEKNLPWPITNHQLWESRGWKAVCVCAEPVAAMQPFLDVSIHFFFHFVETTRIFNEKKECNQKIICGESGR
jgi:hypothetical protein